VSEPFFNVWTSAGHLGIPPPPSLVLRDSNKMAAQSEMTVTYALLIANTQRGAMCLLWEIHSKVCFATYQYWETTDTKLG